MLVITRRKNERIVINDDIVLTIVEIRGDKIRLGVSCPATVPVHRQEVFDAIHGRPPPAPPPRPPEEYPFVQAILADPEDEAARLVFADWLEERGDLLGELLRTQCQLARLPADDPRRADLKGRQRALWGEHGSGLGRIPAAGPVVGPVTGARR